MCDRPNVLVHPDAESVAAEERRFAIEQLPNLPFDLSGTLFTARVASASDVQAVLHAILRGASAAICVDLDESDRADLFDQITRIATLTFNPPAERLDDEQKALLTLLGKGHTIQEAARQIGISARTAARRMERARTLLGAPNLASLLAMTVSLRPDNAAGPARRPGHRDS